VLARIGLYAGVLALLAAPLAACGPKAPMTVESAAGCVDHDWGYHDDEFGARNACNTPVSIWFMQQGGQVMHADLTAGARFSTGLGADQMANVLWAAEVCPAGFEPQPALSAATFDQVRNDQYSCARAPS